jgi:hypothetical protein
MNLKFAFKLITAAGSLGLLLLSYGCAYTPRSHSLSLRWSRPIFPKEIPCIGVLVTGQGIPSQDADGVAADWERVYKGDSCTYAGISSPFQAVSTDTSYLFPLQVPSGVNRTVQVLGLATTSGACPSGTISEILISYRKGTLSQDVLGLYEIARANTDTVKATEVFLESKEGVEKTNDILSCSAKNSGDSGGDSGALKLSITQLDLFPTDVYAFRPTGGTKPYVFSASGTAGSFTSSAGFFRASVTPGVGSVTISDSGGSTPITIPVTVASLNTVGTIQYWYSASSFGNNLDLAAIVNPEKWVDRSGSAVDLDVREPTLGANTFLLTGGPNGNPAIRIESTGGFFSTNNAGLTPDSAMLMVVRRTNTLFPQGLFCISLTGNCPTVGGVISKSLFFVDGLSSGSAQVSASVNTATATSLATQSYDAWTILRSSFQSVPHLLYTKYGGGRRSSGIRASTVTLFLRPPTTSSAV